MIREDRIIITDILPNFGNKMEFFSLKGKQTKQQVEVIERRGSFMAFIKLNN